MIARKNISKKVQDALVSLNNIKNSYSYNPDAPNECETIHTALFDAKVLNEHVQDAVRNLQTIVENLHNFACEFDDVTGEMIDAAADAIDNVLINGYIPDNFTESFGDYSDVEWDEEDTDVSDDASEHPVFKDSDRLADMVRALRKDNICNKFSMIFQDTIYTIFGLIDDRKYNQLLPWVNKAIADFKKETFQSDFVRSFLHTARDILS